MRVMPRLLVRLASHRGKRMFDCRIVVAMFHDSSDWTKREQQKNNDKEQGSKSLPVQSANIAFATGCFCKPTVTGQTTAHASA